MKKKISLCLIILLFFTSCSSQTDENLNQGTLKAIFIDVGEGDACLLIFPSGKSMLIDSGDGGDFARVDAVLKENSIKSIDVIVGTHPHDDHIGAIPAIMKYYSVGGIFLNGKSQSRTYKAVLSAAANQDLEVKTLSCGDYLNVDEQVDIEVIAPNDPLVGKNLNNASSMLLVKYGNHKYVFTGDAEREEEREALEFKGQNLSCDVVKVGHHGSSTSSTPAFAKATSPALAIISVGKNQYGHPDANIINRWKLVGAEVMTTKDFGNIVVESDGHQMWLQTQKQKDEVASKEIDKAA